MKIANNYLAEPEAKQKRRATVMLLDYFEEQVDQGRLVTMAEAANKLVEFIKFNKWPLLTHNGRVARDAANDHALRQLALHKTKMAVEGDEPKKLEKKARSAITSPHDRVYPSNHHRCAQDRGSPRGARLNCIAD